MTLHAAPTLPDAAPASAVRPRMIQRGRASLPARPAARRRPAALLAVVAPTPEPTGISRERAEQLLETYTPAVRQIVGGFQRKLPRNVLRDDLLAAGMCGLWDAIRRHGDDGGDGFEFYVRVRIRGAILDELRAQDWLPRRARAAAQGDDAAVTPAVVRLDDMSEWEQQRTLASYGTTETDLDARSAHESLAEAIDLLPERERHIMSMHYFKGVKFKDLGAELGVSEPRISQLHSRAVARLRGLLAEAA